MDRRRAFLSFEFSGAAGRALQGAFDERKQHVRLACGQVEGDIVRVAASASDLLLPNGEK